MKEVRLIAPSMSLSEKEEIKISKAEEYFKKLGYELTLGKHLFEKEAYFECASIKNRVADLMDAFLDKNVEIIVCAEGGYNVNQILPYLDYDVIKKNPKMIIGYSDITALLIAIKKKTGLVTYYGPMLSGFSSENEYTLQYFEKILENKNFVITSSEEIYDYQKENGKIEKMTLKNEGMIPIQSGTTEGQIIGGNLCTINLLQGTEYMPSLDNCILFIEDDADDFGNDVFLLEFDRNLESLLQLPNCNIKGIVFGRFQLCSNMTIDKLKAVIKGKRKLKHIPILGGADFGHTNPMFTIPIGSYCKLNIENNDMEITIKIEK